MANVLIVEDVPVQAQLVEYHLAALGHHFRTARDGQEALDLIAEAAPDIVLSDVEMPVMDGLVLCAAIKNNAHTRGIPVVLLTAADGALDIVRGMNAQADGYLTKPVDELLLDSMIKRTLERGTDYRLAEDASQEPPLDIVFDGEKVTVSASREQILRLFLSAYESSVTQNRVLTEQEHKLADLNKRLSRNIEQLSASEERFRGLVQTIPDIVYKMDHEGRFTFINDAVHRLGYHQTDLLGRHFKDLICDEDFSSVSADDVLAQRRGKDGEEGDEAPKLFDERRTTDRMTIGLQVRLKTKAGLPANHAEVKAISSQVVHVEVNAMGMYGDGGGAKRQYVGTVGVIRDISERVKAQESMHVAKVAADKANRAKSEFLSSMSHELRTPLNAILGFSQLLDDPSNALNEDQLTAVGHIMDGGEHLLRLINEVLDLSKIEAGSVAISIERMDPVKAVEQCVQMAAAQAEKAGIKLINKVVDGQVPWLFADLIRFKQVLINLMSNAIKYNEPHGTVTLDWMESNDGMVRFSVIDSGPGIPADKQDKLFVPFQRLGRETSTIEGTGIGLTISRELIYRMDGLIGFATEEGKGSTFWIELPMAANLDEETFVRERGDEISTALSEVGGEIREKKTVLYVEDNPANLQLMGRVVRDIPSCRLLTAPTGEIGLEMAREHVPDLILMDIHLPGISGIDVTKILLADEATRHIPIVAISAAAMSSDVEKGRKAGFQAYLTKPFNVGEMVTTIVRFLSDPT